MTGLAESGARPDAAGGRPPSETTILSREKRHCRENTVHGLRFTVYQGDENMPPVRYPSGLPPYAQQLQQAHLQTHPQSNTLPPPSLGHPGFAGGNPNTNMNPFTLAGGMTNGMAVPGFAGAGAGAGGAGGAAGAGGAGGAAEAAGAAEAGAKFCLPKEILRLDCVPGVHDTDVGVGAASPEAPMSTYTSYC